MKILMLGWELPPHNSGGLGVACYQLSRELSSQGADIHFVVPYQADHPDTEFMTIYGTSNLDPETFYKLNMGAYANHLDSQLEKITELEEIHVNSADDRSLRSQQKMYGNYVKRLVKKIKPDVIHAHDWLTLEAGIEAKAVSGRPLVAHVHATEFDRAGSNSHGNPLIHEIEQMGLMMADKIFAVSGITKNIIVEKYNIPANKIEVVHNSIDPSSLAGQKAVEQDSYLYARSLQQEGYIVVAAVCRLTVQKGLTHFLHAAAKASQVIDRMVFLIAGDGEQRDELIKLSADLGISDKVLFTGFVRGARWRQIYNLADVFVMSSISEPFGLTALEAAAHDTSVILTKQSGVVEVLRNILKYDFWDVNRLADQIINLASSNGLRDELSKNAKSEFMNMSWHGAAQKCQHQYHTLGATT
jgi:glycogen(starch) synthase